MSKEQIYAYMDLHPRCVVCGALCNDKQPHHWRTQGAGGSDDDDNLDRLCFKHHKEAHRTGIKEFAIKHKLHKPRAILMARNNWSEEDERRFNN